MVVMRPDKVMSPSSSDAGWKCPSQMVSPGRRGEEEAERPDGSDRATAESRRRAGRRSARRADVAGESDLARGRRR